MDVDGCRWMWMDVDGCRWMWMDVDGCGWMWMASCAPVRGFSGDLFKKRPKFAKIVEIASKLRQNRGIWARILELDIGTTKNEFRACDLTPGGSKKTELSIFDALDVGGCRCIWM